MMLVTHTAAHVSSVLFIAGHRSHHAVMHEFGCRISSFVATEVAVVTVHPATRPHPAMIPKNQATVVALGHRVIVLLVVLSLPFMLLQDHPLLLSSGILKPSGSDLFRLFHAPAALLTHPRSISIQRPGFSSQLYLPAS